MKENVEKVLERDQKLSELEYQAGNDFFVVVLCINFCMNLVRISHDTKQLFQSFPEKLQEGASMFEKQAGALKNKFWLENMKVKVFR